MPFAGKDFSKNRAKDLADKTAAAAGKNGPTGADALSGLKGSPSPFKDESTLNKLGDAMSRDLQRRSTANPGKQGVNQNPGNLPTTPARNVAPVFKDPTLGDIINGAPTTNPLGVAGKIAGTVTGNSLADLLGLDTSVPDSYGDGSQDVLGGGAKDATQDTVAKPVAKATPNGDPVQTAADLLSEYTGPNLKDKQLPYDQGGGLAGDTQDGSPLVNMLAKPASRYKPKLRSIFEMV